MATFEIGDWVQITPTPDEKWEHWTKEHTAMTSMIGEILEKDTAQYDSSIKFVRIMVYDENNDPLKQEWFLERQIILSTRYDKVLADERDRACEELQKWEKKKREMIDENLRHAFGLEPIKKSTKKKKKDTTTALKVDSADEEVWEGPTEEIEQETIDEILEIIDGMDGFDYDALYDGPDGAD
tara:strand:- start:241 stop:789 length:549 start_codon:yes stop_codon:yes gene_type:complete